MFLSLNPQHWPRASRHQFHYVPPFPFSLYVFQQVFAIKFFHLHPWCLKGKLFGIVSYNKHHFRNVATFDLASSLTSPMGYNKCHSKNIVVFDVSKFYSWRSITIEHWNIMQLASCNNILVALILIVIPPSTNYILLKELGFCFGKLKFDYNTSSWNLNLILNLDPSTCNVSRF